jgi:seryl-tRNA synthetase
MLDPNLLKKDFDDVVARLKTRNFEFPVEDYKALEQQRKEIQTQTEEAQARRNQVAKAIGAAKKNGEDATALMQEGADLAAKLGELETATAAVKEKLQALLMRIPNLPHPTVPVGRDERDNVEVKRWGTPRTFDFPIKDHVDVGAPLGLNLPARALLS